MERRSSRESRAALACLRQYEKAFPSSGFSEALVETDEMTACGLAAGPDQRGG
jgi:hypothetical protein